MAVFRRLLLNHVISKFGYVPWPSRMRWTCSYEIFFLPWGYFKFIFVNIFNNALTKTATICQV